MLSVACFRFSNSVYWSFEKSQKEIASGFRECLVTQGKTRLSHLPAFFGRVENRTSNSLINKISVLEIEIIRKLLVTVLLISLYVGVGCDKELLWGDEGVGSTAKWTLIQYLNLSIPECVAFCPVFLPVSSEVMFLQVSNPFHSMPYHLTWETC